MQTAAGWWKAPIRFLPAGWSIATLPPTLESTCASSVVGHCTNGTPRLKVAAAKPARSPTTPPPSATTGESRSRRSSTKRSQRCGELLDRLGGLAVGDDRRVHVETGVDEARARRLPVEFEDRGHRDQRDAPREADRPQARAERREEAVADPDRVGALAEGDGDGLDGGRCFNHGVDLPRHSPFGCGGRCCNHCVDLPRHSRCFVVRRGGVDPLPHVPSIVFCRGRGSTPPLRTYHPGSGLFSR